LSDRDPFAAMSADPQVKEYFPNTLTRSESDAIAENARRLLRKEDGEFGLSNSVIPKNLLVWLD